MQLTETETRQLISKQLSELSGCVTWEEEVIGVTYISKETLTAKLQRLIELADNMPSD